MRKVEVTPYSVKWKSDFETESKRLQAIFGAEVIDIHHIGSTSVCGLAAKPIIDIMPVVKDISLIDKYTDEMDRIGYEAKGENGIPGRRYFQKGGNERTHHVHIYEQGSRDIERHLAFRDYLRVHPNISKQYGDLKERLANQFPDDIDAYIDGKAEFASEIERQAVRWYRQL
ncbi:GrpB family protein [Sporosarcina saromensis]|uniref:GrpB family protein n=1 Tax=Sporosarcina saromensis TaxID=359365 RepID=A0ABU4GEF1_9BACL|nr:GrpB family protein [Sporosarcina saromensis]MDW0115301.1 GrpB family protein [Sporosarcina saromensis]